MYSQPPADTPLHGPRKRDLIRLFGLLWEMRSLPRAFREVRADVEGKPPVTVIPGLWASDRTMRVMHRYLRRAGYDVQGWGLGLNRAGTDQPAPLSTLPDHWLVPPDKRDKGEGEVPHLIERVTTVILERFEKEGRPIALVGWSLGGYIAREIARNHPEAISTVVTLGTPVIGGPKYSVAAWRYKMRGYNMDWLEEVTLLRHERPIQCPVHVLYSKMDAIIGWPAAIDHWTPSATHHRIDCSHAGFGFRADTLRHVKNALDQSFEV